VAPQQPARGDPGGGGGGGTDVVLGERAFDAVLEVAAEDGGARARQSAGSSRYCTARSGAPRNDTRPPGGSTPRTTANSSTSRTPLTNGGTARAAVVVTRIALRTQPLREVAPRMPKAVPSTMTNSRAATVSSAVAPRPSAIRSETWPPIAYEGPRSPVTREPNHWPYWESNGASRPSRSRIAATVAASASGPASEDAGSPGTSRRMVKIRNEAPSRTRRAEGSRLSR